MWGNQASVLVGDFLLGQAFRMMVDVGSLGALKILSSAAAVIAEGEVMQLAAAKNTATTEDEYLAIINAKTAALFSAATEVGAAIANRPAEEQTALKSYGRNLGVAFQLVDDALDYSGDSARLGKSVGDDFREGKITLPVILCFRRGSDDERAFWKRTLSDGEIEDGDLEHAIRLMKQHSAIEATLERARHYGAIARDALAIFRADAARPRADRRHRLLHQPDELRPIAAHRRAASARPTSADARLASAAAALRCRRLVGKDAEAGRAAAGHRGDAAAGLRGQCCLDVGDGRQERGRRSLEIVAAAAHDSRRGLPDRTNGPGGAGG